MTDETPRALRNRRFAEFKAKNPDATYAEWTHGSAVRCVKDGGQHATLGGNLRRHSDWWEAGRSTFERYRKIGAIGADTRVVDYGCGSLRVGAHVIRHVNAGRYFGLDVTTALIEVGKDLAGAELIAEKAPQFGAIDAAMLEKAEAFGADCVISTAVCYHVFPDEAPAYFGNLKRLAHKPGAKLLFDLSVSDNGSPDHALSMPLEYYVRMLAPMEFVKFHRSVERDGLQLGIAEFRQPAAA
jgi:SAM-dependent methyltransferase